jgi:hypothetical protein
MVQIRFELAEMVQPKTVVSKCLAQGPLASGPFGADQTPIERKLHRVPSYTTESTGDEPTLT